MKDRWGSGPAYNPEACRFIEKYGEANGFEFKHAENGGEHFIEDLGYWVDGYDAEQNVVLEYYEPWHRKSSNRSRDKARREEIMSHLGCTFIVHREWDGTTTKYE
jgi:hypothetical protein